MAFTESLYHDGQEGRKNNHNEVVKKEYVVNEARCMKHMEINW
jgi:hypothetical protein